MARCVRSDAAVPIQLKRTSADIIWGSRRSGGHFRHFQFCSSESAFIFVRRSRWPDSMKGKRTLYSLTRPSGRHWYETPSSLTGDGRPAAAAAAAYPLILKQLRKANFSNYIASNVIFFILFHCCRFLILITRDRVCTWMCALRNTLRIK